MTRITAVPAWLIAAVLIAGCTSTDTEGALNLSAPSESSEPATAADAQGAGGSDQQTAEAGGDVPAAATATQPDQAGDAPAVAAVSSNARVQFAPVIGAPSASVPPLSERLSARAAERGIALVASGDSATLLMKGYFSAIADGNATTVIYVWDVLDGSGNRLHRIQGQQKSSGGRGDGWSSVTPATMQAIADQTIDQLAAWLASRQS